MFISQKEKEAIRREFNNLWNNVGILENARQGLFTPDGHGTVRPKVDMLDDNLDHHLQGVWKSINEFEERIVKLEKK